MKFSWRKIVIPLGAIVSIPVTTVALASCDSDSPTFSLKDDFSNIVNSFTNTFNGSWASFDYKKFFTAKENGEEYKITDVSFLRLSKTGSDFVKNKSVSQVNASLDIFLNDISKYKENIRVHLNEMKTVSTKERDEFIKSIDDLTLKGILQYYFSYNDTTKQWDMTPKLISDFRFKYIPNDYGTTGPIFPLLPPENSANIIKEEDIISMIQSFLNDLYNLNKLINTL